MKPGTFNLGPQEKRGSLPRQFGLAVAGLALSAGLFNCAPQPQPVPLCGPAAQLASSATPARTCG